VPLFGRYFILLAVAKPVCDNISHNLDPIPGMSRVLLSAVSMDKSDFARGE
jgi:hypothetical protein